VLLLPFFGYALILLNKIQKQQEDGFQGLRKEVNSLKQELVAQRLELKAELSKPTSSKQDEAIQRVKPVESVSPVMPVPATEYFKPARNR
jgi:hypothetical protein